MLLNTPVQTTTLELAAITERSDGGYDMEFNQKVIWQVSSEELEEHHTISQVAASKQLHAVWKAIQHHKAK